MRLKFRSHGQAEQYYKICRGILEENSSGPEGSTECHVSRLWLQQFQRVPEKLHP